MSHISDKDRQIVRDLAKRVDQVATDPIQDRKVAEWKRHNSLTPGKPLVLVYVEDVWDEFLPAEAFQCTDELCRPIEVDLRRRLYQAEHLRDDRPVTAEYNTSLVIDDPGCGVEWDWYRPEVTDKRTAAAFRPVIADDADPDQTIPNRTLTVNWETSRKRHEQVSELLGDILTVRMQGVQSFCFAAVDALLTWRGVERFFWDIIDRPQWVRRLLERITETELDAARQLEAAGVLELNNGSNGIGSGGIGATDELPAHGFNGEHVRLKDLWGFATTQIFSEVSPAMHEEFAIQYESQYLSMFGLNCYGCCEPLHKKVDLVRKLPRVRRVSMSPFVDWVEGAEQIGGEFIYSAKPQPAYLAAETWDIGPARREIETILQATKRNGCVVEFVLNGTLTSRGEPHRYDEWTDMVQQLTETHT